MSSCINGGCMKCDNCKAHPEEAAELHAILGSIRFMETTLAITAAIAVILFFLKTNGVI